MEEILNGGRVRENFALLDFELVDDDLCAITALNRAERTGPDPDTCNRVPRGERAVAEGIVTSDEGPFTDMVSGSPPEIRELALDARRLIFAVLPQTVEVVWPQQRTAGYGTGPKKMTEHFCWLAPFSRHLVFGFYYGSELPDPTGLLEGTGRLMRHAELRVSDELQDPALRRLIELATTHRVPPPSGAWS